jgi:hypothetical protein
VKMNVCSKYEITKGNIYLCKIKVKLRLNLNNIEQIRNDYWNLRAPKLFDRVKCEFKMKKTKNQDIEDALPNSQHFGWCNHSLGLATKAKGLQECGPRGSPGVTSHTLGRVRKCEGVNPHTPKVIPILGDGLPMDSRNFKEQFQGVKTQWLVTFFISLESSWNVDV